MSRVDHEMLYLEEEMRGIQESGSLFEVNVPEFKLLKQCRKELRMLKVMSTTLYYNTYKMYCNNKVIIIPLEVFAVNSWCDCIM